MPFIIPYFGEKILNRFLRVAEKDGDEWNVGSCGEESAKYPFELAQETDDWGGSCGRIHLPIREWSEKLQASDFPNEVKDAIKAAIENVQGK